MAIGVIGAHAVEEEYAAPDKHSHASIVEQKLAVRHANGMPVAAAGQSVTAFIIPALFKLKTAEIAEHKQELARVIPHGQAGARAAVMEGHQHKIAAPAVLNQKHARQMATGVLMVHAQEMEQLSLKVAEIADHNQKHARQTVTGAYGEHALDKVLARQDKQTL